MFGCVAFSGLGLLRCVFRRTSSDGPCPVWRGDVSVGFVEATKRKDSLNRTI